MKITVRNQGLMFTESQQAYIDKKLKTLSRYGDFLRTKSQAVQLDLAVKKLSGNNLTKGLKLSLTMKLPEAVLHVESEGKLVEEIVDLGLDKLKRQLKRYKEKHQFDMHDGGLPIKLNALAV